MNHARFETSDRLQKTLEYLIDGKPRSTREIMHGADICAVNSAVDELRENGFDVPCIKKSRPAIYQLINPAAARALAASLLKKAA